MKLNLLRKLCNDDHWPFIQWKWEVGRGKDELKTDDIIIERFFFSLGPKLIMEIWRRSRAGNERILVSFHCSIVRVRLCPSQFPFLLIKLTAANFYLFPFSLFIAAPSQLDRVLIALPTATNPCWTETNFGWH